MQNTVADGLAAVASHPVTVQVITQGPGIWGNVATGLITGLMTGGIALTGIWLTHWFTLKREKLASEDRLQREHYFIATELVFLLERYADECAGVATDDGEYDASGERDTVTALPVLTLDDVKGDWRVLPGLLMFRIRELLMLQHESKRMIAGAAEYDTPPDYKCYFQERQYQYARLGLKAIIQARRLRKSAGLPATRLDATNWSAQPAMWTVWRRERRRRAADVIRNAEFERVLNAEDDPEADARCDEHQRLSGAES